MQRNLLTLSDLSSSEIEKIFAITEDLKLKFDHGVREPILPGRVMALLFQKKSLRTRVSFEAGMAHLGGSSLFLGDDVGWGSRESIADFARVLSQYVDVIVVRANDHQAAVELAGFSSCPVINGLTPLAHPCQALCDLYTLRELVGRLAGHTVAYVGDGNNVARSLAMCCAKLGMTFRLATPPGYAFDDEVLSTLHEQAPEADVTLTEDPREAVAGAIAVYTDVWTSMGQESESARRRADFADYQVTPDLMAHADSRAVFMHCLPAHRGEEVAAEVIDGPQSVVVSQAANRMHVQKGILTWLVGPQK